MSRVLLACLALLQIAPLSAQDLESITLRAEAITRQGGQIASRRLRREMQERMEAAKVAARQGDLQRADALLREMQTELSKLTQADPDWQPLLEMDGPLNTNYQAGVGFVLGGTDPDPTPAVVIRDGVPFITTDASQKTFPNQRTDTLTFERNAKPLTDLARATAEILGRRVPLKFHRPIAGFETGLETGVDKIQFVVNQLFTTDGHDVLATWALPPHWSPGRRYVTLIGVPGMSHTNNSKLFAEPSLSFLRAWLTAVRDSRDAGIVFVHFNCGGRSAMGLHPGFEQVLDTALRWGEAHLGARRDAIVLNGGSRGGYGALCWGGRLASMNYGVRGIFASVFGIASAETSTPFELVASMATNYGIYGEDFADWKDLLYKGDGSDVRRRYLGVSGVDEVEALGPLGSVPLLGKASEQSPIHLYLAYGSADPTSLMSSYHRTCHALARHPGLRIQADFFLGAGHEAGNAHRNQLAAEFTSALARGETPSVSPGRTYRQGTSATTGQTPAHLRLPLRTIPGRTPICDLTGPAGASYDLRIFDGEREVLRETGVFNDEEIAKSQLAAPAPGIYRLELRVDDQIIGQRTFQVVEGFPDSFVELRTEWIADRMPVIEGFVTPGPGGLSSPWD